MKFDYYKMSSIEVKEARQGHAEGASPLERRLLTDKGTFQVVVTIGVSREATYLYSESDAFRKASGLSDEKGSNTHLAVMAVSIRNPHLGSPLVYC